MIVRNDRKNDECKEDELHRRSRIDLSSTRGEHEVSSPPRIGQLFDAKDSLSNLANKEND